MSYSRSHQESFRGYEDPADDIEADALMASDDALTAEFRYRIGILPEEEDELTEAFKARIGLIGREEIQEISEIQLSIEEAHETTPKDFKFDRWLKKNLQKGQTGTWSKEPLSAPLLAKEHDVDKRASVAVWLAIQIFMGDVANPKPSEVRSKTPMMTKIYQTLETLAKRTDANANVTDGKKGKGSGSKRKSFKLFGKDKDKDKDKGKDKGKFDSVSSTGSADLVYHENAAAMMEIIPTEELDLIHFIVGHGILRKDLRDEIFCQISKQITKNSSRESTLRGWMLHALCAGCFVPSDDFIGHFRNFLKEATEEYAEYALYTRRILRRSVSNGPRYHPPNWLEYQATKMRKYVMLPVAMMDGQVDSVETDSAITSSEMCQKLANNINLKDTFGFSIFICIYDKVSSLGNGSDHVMDAISECEQVVRSKGNREEDAPWRLFLRKEMFVPWHDPTFDAVSTNLIYSQITRGIRAEEYALPSEEAMARHVTKRWYIEQGMEILPGKLQSTLHDYLPKSALSGSKSRDGWTQAILASFNDQGFSKESVSKDDVKYQVVVSAPRKWPLQFAGLFEAFKISGPRLPKNDVVVAVSSKGLYILDDPFKVQLAFHYYQIVEIFANRSSSSRGQSFTLITIKGDEFTFVTPNSQTVVKLVTKFLDGLRRRSQWGVGLQEFVLEDAADGQTFSFKQGDILELTSDTARGEEWVVAINDRNKEKGQLPLDCIYILPCLDKPTREFLDMFTKMSAAECTTLPRRRGAVLLSKGTLQRRPSGQDGGVLESAA